MISAKKNKAMVVTQPISLPKTKKQGLMQRWRGRGYFNPKDYFYRFLAYWGVYSIKFVIKNKYAL